MTLLENQVIFTAMNPESEFPSGRAPEPGDEELREMLAAAERRNEAALQQSGRKTTVLIAVLLLAAFAWAMVIFIQTRSQSAVVEPAPAPAAPTREQVAQREDMAAFDPFRPPSQRVGEAGKPATAPPGRGGIIDKGDIEFAMDLLNFVQPGASPHAEKH